MEDMQLGIVQKLFHTFIGATPLHVPFVLSLSKVMFTIYPSLDARVCQGGHGGGGVDAGHRDSALPGLRAISFAKIQTED